MTESPSESAAIHEGTERAAGRSLRRLIILVTAALIGAVMLLFVLAIVIALTSDLEQSSAVIRLFRDLVIIFLALEGILIVLALGILILQIAKLINLLQTEVKPILENTQQTVKTAQGTVEFVSQNALTPILRLSGFLAGASVLTRELFGIRRAVRRSGDDDGRTTA
jgi:hypothetical protein